MVDEERDPSAEEQTPADASPSEEEIVVPRSKYELIMMAAAEATRLNEEIRSKSDDELRRKGINIEGKITLEALRRVREGKVKAIMRKGSPLRPPTRPAPTTTAPTAEGLFFSPPKPDEEAEAAEGSGSEDTAPKSEE
jgi:DNA-directed RNA polymerase subunit K/omega